jgi:hypothetical protein
MGVQGAPIVQNRLAASGTRRERYRASEPAATLHASLHPDDRKTQQLWDAANICTLRTEVSERQEGSSE